MPTATGRETAQEKRDRQYAAEIAKLEAAAALLPEGWAEGEASSFATEYHQHQGERLYQVKREYPTEVEAFIVCRIVNRTYGIPAGKFTSFWIGPRDAGQTTYGVHKYV